MPSQKKITIVSSLVEKIKNNPNFVVIDFDHATHLTLESLRHALREQQATMEVVKNSLFKVALSKAKKSELDKGEMIQGKSAIVALPEDWGNALAAFFKFAKTTEGLVFKIGIVDGTVYEKAGLEQLAQLPSREELIVKILSSLRSSQTRTVYAMNFGMMKFVNVLRSKADKS